jgi:acetyltransferase-like isoleucine patch superfamily enzyme
VNETSAETVKIHGGVEFLGGFDLGPFVIIGVPPRGTEEGSLETRIGADATIRSHTVIYAGNEIGDRFQTGHGVAIREENQIGADVSVGTGSVIEHHVRIGSGVRIHSQAFIPEYSVLEDGCWIGPNVVITNAKYPRSPDVKNQLRGAVVHRGAKIGANATLLPGVEIGRDALVGAGSVVTRNVAPGDVVAGNPARVIKTVADLPYAEQEG